MNKKFIDFMGHYPDVRLAVAVSGGADSVCLLCWLVNLGLDVVALHVNHGLRTVANTEEAYVKEFCDKLNIPCYVFHWSGAKPDSNLESHARTARYNLMTDFCHKNDIENLLVAHHKDDQIETFLMNLSRGSGLRGLSAMQAVSVRNGINLVRPLLSVGRIELQEYCKKNNIKYFTDEMNSDDKYTRVKIRQNRHLLQEKLGISDDRILLAIENLSRARDAVDFQVSQLVEKAMFSDFALFAESFLFDLLPEIRLQLLGRLFQKIGGNNYQPRLTSLTGALDRLHNDCKFTLANCTVRRLGKQILIVPEGAKTSIRKKNEKIKRNEKQEQKHI